MDQPASDISGIKIICLCPGVTDTPMTSKQNPPRFPELAESLEKFLHNTEAQSPEVVADAMIQAFKDDSHGIWIVNQGGIKKSD